MAKNNCVQGTVLVYSEGDPELLWDCLSPAQALQNSARIQLRGHVMNYANTGQQHPVVSFYRLSDSAHTKTNSSF